MLSHTHFHFYSRDYLYRHAIRSSGTPGLLMAITASQIPSQHPNSHRYAYPSLQRSPEVPLAPPHPPPLPPPPLHDRYTHHSDTQRPPAAYTRSTRYHRSQGPLA